MPERLISAIRNSFVNSVHIYTQGSCWDFYKILKCVFPDAEAYFDSDHVITKINGRFYDITGEVEPKPNHIPVEGNYTIEMMEKTV